MQRLVRTLLMFLVLVFAAGTMMHGVQAADMVVKMSPTAVDGEMPDCDGCGDGNSAKQVCSMICIAPAIATDGSAIFVLDESVIDPAMRPVEQIAGRHTLVDPHPPRRHVLI